MKYNQPGKKIKTTETQNLKILRVSVPPWLVLLRSNWFLGLRYLLLLRFDFF
jgi:hypothetical protein